MKAATVIDDRGREDGAVACKLAVPKILLEQRLDTVIRLQVGIEVQLTAEYLREAKRQVNALTRPADRRHEGWMLGIDATAHGHRQPAFRIQQDFSLQRLGPAFFRPGHAEKTIIIDGVLKRAEQPAEADHQFVRLSRAKPTGIERGPRRRDDEVRDIPTNLVRAQ